MRDMFHTRAYPATNQVVDHAENLVQLASWSWGPSLIITGWDPQTTGKLL